MLPNCYNYRFEKGIFGRKTVRISEKGQRYKKGKKPKTKHFGRYDRPITKTNGTPPG